jgi:hypothetical protein
MTMTTTGRISPAQWRGAEFTSIGPDNHPLFQVTKRNDQGQELTLTLDPMLLNPKGQIDFLKLCRQHNAEQTDHFLQEIEECTRTVRDYNQMIEQHYGTSTLSSAAPIDEIQDPSPREVDSHRKKPSWLNSAANATVSFLKKFCSAD